MICHPFFGPKKDHKTSFIGRFIFNSGLTLSRALNKLFHINPLSPKIHVQILQTDLHTFVLRMVERVWFKIKAFSLW